MDKELMVMFKDMIEHLDKVLGQSTPTVVRGMCQSCSKSLTCPVLAKLPGGGTMAYCNQFEDNRRAV